MNENKKELNAEELEQVNGGADIRVRGGKSITQSNESLIIIDGVSSGSGINDIPASDIEDITPLKDAASTAIYGSKAANGVELI